MSYTQDGIASPNPDFPQNINTFTGENFVEICGSQLFDKSDLIGGWIRSYDGLYFNQYTTTYGCTPFIPVKPSTAYTLNLSNKSGLDSAGVCYYDMNKNWTNGIPENVNVINFTTNSDTKYIRFTVRQDAKSSVQLLEGTYTEQTMPTYQAYKSQRKEINLGKNLLDYTKISSVSNGANNEGVITSTTTAQAGTLNVILWFANGSFVVPKGSKVYFSADIKLTEGSTGLFSRLNDGYVGNQDTIVHPVLSTEYQRYQTATTYSSETKIQSMLIQFSDLLGSAEIKNIMISFSDDVKFEPYFEPIELGRIGNYKDFIRKGTGKNRFAYPYFDTTKTTNGITFTDNGNGSITINGTATNTATFLLAGGKWSYDNTQIYPKGTYTLNRIANTSGVYLCLNMYNEDNTTQFYSSAYGVQSFTTDGNQSMAYPRIAVANGTTVNNLTVFPMLVKGTEIGLYEPYGYKNKWYIHKEIGKIKVTGSETMAYYSVTQGSLFRVYLVQSIGGVPMYCTHYIGIANSSGRSNGKFYYNPGASSNLLAFDFMDDRFTNVTDFKNWLTTVNVEVYYILPTPTDIEINEDNYPGLISQLQALEDGYTYEGTTNIINSGIGSIDISVDKPYREPVDTITAANYLMDFTKSRDYGPVNKVQITLEGIEDAEYIENSDSIYREGIQTITINDNYFMGTIDARKASIGILWNALYRMKYLPAKFTYLGYPYLEMGDFISIVLPDGTIKNTYIFNYEFVYNGGYMGTIETPTISRTQEEYPTDGLDLRISRMGINVDRANGRITAEIIAREEADETIMGEYVPNAVFNDYQTTLTQTIDQINTSVSAANTVLYGENDDGLISQVNQNATEISQTAESITAIVRDVSTVTSQVDSLEENTQDVVNQLQFTNEGLTISNKGSTSEDMKLNLTNEAINFMYRNNVVLKINGSEIEFTNASFRKLDLGNFVWLAEEDGSLSLIYEGGNS